MNFIKKLFSTKKAPDESPEETGDVTKTMGLLINNAAKDVFLTNKMTLLEEPLTYIVPAVWGVVKDGTITEEQRRMHETLEPTVREVLRLFSYDRLTDSQKHAASFIVRDLIVSKVVYMIQIYKIALGGNFEDEKNDLLNARAMGEG